jgi:hypothetical protein
MWQVVEQVKDLAFDGRQRHLWKCERHIWNFPILDSFRPTWELLIHHREMLVAIQGDAKVRSF